MRSRTVVVDDSTLFRDAACELLNAEGYDVVGVAANGRDALTVVKYVRPEIVVLDVALPDTDGFALATKLSRLPDPPAVVLVSSRDWSDLGARIRACGARGFLPKDALSASALTAMIGASQ